MKILRVLKTKRVSLLLMCFLSCGVLKSTLAQESQDQYCGYGFVDNLYAGGWENGEIYISIVNYGLPIPNYFNEPLQVMRFDPALTERHKNMIYSTLLLAIANQNFIELRSHTQTAGGVADCSLMDQVTIQNTEDQGF